MLTRRTFLATGAALATLPVLQAFALEAGPGDGRLVVIFLRGGMDGLFAVSPVDDPRLAALRPTLSRAVLEKGSRLPGTGFALHPSCAALADLYAKRELAFAPCAGTSDTSRSHFQAQDLFEFGSGRKHGDSGFLARAALALGDRRGAVSFTRDSPLAFAGEEDVSVDIVPLSGGSLKLPDGPALAAIRAAHRRTATGDALEQALQTQAEIEAAAADTMLPGMEPGASRGAGPAAGFPREAAQMGRLLRANPRLALAFIDIGGWDTHANQEGPLSRALEGLSAGLLGLKDALGEAEWRRTRVVVMSEFGRTARQNGTQGTDHGRGGLALLLGGAIEGGRMLGDFRGLDTPALNEARDLPVLVDWRALLAACMRESWGLGKRQLATVFPGMPVQDLRV